MLQSFNAGRLRAGRADAGVRAASGVFAQVMNDGAGSGERLRMIVKAKSGQLRDAELFAQNAFGVVALKDPVFEAALDPAGTIEQRSLRGFKKLLRTGKKRFSRMKKLQLVAHRLVGIRPGKFRGLELAC